MDVDLLHDIRLDELQELRKMCCDRLGRTDSTLVVSVLKNCEQWMKRFSEDPYVTVSSPHGNWREHLTFVAEFNMPFQHMIFFFSLEESNRELIDAMFGTKRISWKGPLLFAAIYDFNRPTVNALLNSKIFEQHEFDLTGTETYAFCLKFEDALKFNTNVPNEHTQLGPLSAAKHTDLVNLLWPHRYKNSDQYIKASISRNTSMGLFLNGELVSWAFVNFLGLIASLQTTPEHYCKGYGSLVTRSIAKVMAEDEWDCCGTVLIKNEKSAKLFSQLGFKPQKNIAIYYEIIPKSNNN